MAPRRPPVDLDALRREGLLHLEVARGTLTLRDYAGPLASESGRGYERSLVRWTVAVTRRRLVVARRRGPMVAVPWIAPQAAALSFAVDGKSLLVRFDAAAFRSDAVGAVEVRVRCGDPPAVLSLLEGLRAHARR